MVMREMCQRVIQKGLDVQNNHLNKLLPLMGILILLHIYVAVQGQSNKYVMLDMLDSAYRVNRYTLDTKELYGTEHTIEVYNVWLNNALVLFSVLPDFKDGVHWEKVDTTGISDYVVSNKDFHRSMLDKYLVEGSVKKSMNYRLVKHVGSDLYASKNCLFEYFNIRDYPSALHATYGTINTGQSKLTIREMEVILNERYPNSTFPLDIRSVPSMTDQLLLRREYVSKEFEVNGEKAYQFWTFTDWNVSDGLNTHRGIDRFIYIPGKGIVGGSYDFYFYFFRTLRTVSPDEMWQNILYEKVMLAEELK